MRAFGDFARAPLAWSFATLALYAPLAFVAPVIDPPPADCTDWLWCDSRYVGLVFDATPTPHHLTALAIIPATLLIFLAARIAARGPNRHAHWFMAGPVLAFIACTVFFQIVPMHFWIDTSASYRPAVIVISLLMAFSLAILASLPIALLTLLGALFTRRLSRSAAATRSSRRG